MRYVYRRCQSDLWDLCRNTVGSYGTGHSRVTYGERLGYTQLRNRVSCIHYGKSHSIPYCVRHKHILLHGQEPKYWEIGALWLEYFISARDWRTIPKACNHSLARAISIQAFLVYLLPLKVLTLMSFFISNAAKRSIIIIKWPGTNSPNAIFACSWQYHSRRASLTRSVIKWRFNNKVHGRLLQEDPAAYRRSSFTIHIVDTSDTSAPSLSSTTLTLNVAS